MKGSSTLSEGYPEIELSFTLKNLEWLGKAKPKMFQILLQSTMDGGTLGVTEQQKIGLKLTNFLNKISVSHIFEKKQNFEINFLPNRGKMVKVADFSLSELLGHNERFMTFNFLNSEHRIKGELKVCFNSVEEKKNSILLQQESRYSKEQQELLDRYMFSHYVTQNLNISMITCIDFTASNGYVDFEFSLHHIKEEGLNDYQKVIQSVCEILIDYDKDKLIQVYGFGGVPSGFQDLELPKNKVSHFFPLSGDWHHCAGQGIDGVFSLYTQALEKVKLSGPTLFAPMFKEIIDFTESNYLIDKSNYTIMLVLTDGCIHDMNDTIREIVRGSELPLSIIIVGVGQADFTKMQILDSDDRILVDSTGKAALRDIVQFVPFNQFKKQGSDVLAEEVLKEIPKQVADYVRMKEHKRRVDSDSRQNSGSSNTFGEQMWLDRQASRKTDIVTGVAEDNTDLLSMYASGKDQPPAAFLYHQSDVRHMATSKPCTNNFEKQPKHSTTNELLAPGKLRAVQTERKFVSNDLDGKRQHKVGPGGNNIGDVQQYINRLKVIKRASFENKLPMDQSYPYDYRQIFAQAAIQKRNTEISTKLMPSPRTEAAGTNTEGGSKVLFQRAPKKELVEETSPVKVYKAPRREEVSEVMTNPILSSNSETQSTFKFNITSNELESIILNDKPAKKTPVVSNVKRYEGSIKAVQSGSNGSPTIKGVPIRSSESPSLNRMPTRPNESSGFRGVSHTKPNESYGLKGQTIESESDRIPVQEFAQNIGMFGSMESSEPTSNPNYSDPFQSNNFGNFGNFGNFVEESGPPMPPMPDYLKKIYAKSSRTGSDLK